MTIMQDRYPIGTETKMPERTVKTDSDTESEKTVISDINSASAAETPDGTWRRKDAVPAPGSNINLAL